MTTDPTLQGIDPDADVVRRVRQGERDAFELLMRRHNVRVFRAVRAFVRDADEAEDVMQEAYLRAFRSLDRFEGRSLFVTWLTRIAIHEALARRRRRERSAAHEIGDVMDGTFDPAALASSAELGRILEDAIDRLPEPFRSVFVLRAVEQVPVCEVAECLELEEATVKTRLFRAKALLQGLLARHAESHAPYLFPFPRQRCDRVVANVLQRLSP